MQGSEGVSFAYDSFIRVNPRKKRRKGKVENAATPSDLLTRVKEELETDGGWSLGCKEILHGALREAGIKPQKALCLGLGSPSSSRESRAQLALLSCLCASISVDAADSSVYDPVFTDADRKLFQTLGMRCLDHVQGAEHSMGHPMLLYMPHCEMRLYETVIRTNWTLEGLCSIVFVANRFSDYIDSNASSKLEKEAPCMMRLVPFVESRTLPTSGVFPSAFNNVSVQYVSRTPLSLQGDAFWETRPVLDWDHT